MTRWEIVYEATTFIAEEMGAALRRSSFSPNIKERADHSCAVVDPGGRIVAQAEHIPVHLGSFKIGVANLLSWLERENIELNEGDMVLVNDPYVAGTHLNDLMLLAPVYAGGRLVAYVVNKAHHVDVGGPVPGSINPGASTLYEEGLVIPPVKLTRRGELNKEVLGLISANTKTPDVTLNDILAQLAANITGARRIKELVERYGARTVFDCWAESLEYGRRISLSHISRWPRGSYVGEDYLEGPNGELLRVRVTIDISSDGVKADFEGTHEQIDKPLNAVLGVTFSAVSYPIRCLLPRETPTNDGFYSTITVKAPEGSLVNPVKPAPVSGGNLETSQRVCDAVFKALSLALPDKVPAAGSGTMMNVMMGGSSAHRGYWSYYETIGGGSGGRPSSPGVSGVHTNMTNTLNTPVEVLEKHYPIVIAEYRIRDGSGGEGLHRGGDGIVRRYLILEKTRVAVLADRVALRPWGLMGGEPGKPARIMIKRADGSVEEAGSKFVTTLDNGDELIIETPGGGGWGRVNRSPRSGSP